MLIIYGIASSNIYTSLNIALKKKKKKTPIIYFSYIPTLLSTNFNLKKSNSVTF